MTDESGPTIVQKMHNFEFASRALKLGYIARRESWSGCAYLSGATVMSQGVGIVLMIPEPIDDDHNIDPAQIRGWVAAPEDEAATDWLVRDTPARILSEIQNG